MLEVEVFGAELAPGAPSPQEVRRLCALATTAAGVQDGHLAIEYVDEQRIARLNAEHRGKDGPTDVLSFPIDGAVGHRGGVERELGDVVICPAHTSDLREAIVHGVLHLVGFDHETDDGEMLALQAELLARESR
jgi:probable rRNA maturation factor